jgi:hypothetical protein
LNTARRIAADVVEEAGLPIKRPTPQSVDPVDIWQKLGRIANGQAGAGRDARKAAAALKARIDELQRGIKNLK